MHRWENTLAKYRVLSVTCDHYRRSLGLPLIFVFTYITKNAPCNQSLFALVKSPKLYIWFICWFFTLLVKDWCRKRYVWVMLTDSICISLVGIIYVFFINFWLRVEINSLCLIWMKKILVYNIIHDQRNMY